MTDKGFSGIIPTPKQLRAKYAESSAVQEAIRRTVAGVKLANDGGAQALTIGFNSMAITQIVQETFTSQGYRATISNDHGEEARGEYYCLLYLDWSLQD